MSKNTAFVLLLVIFAAMSNWLGIIVVLALGYAEYKDGWRPFK